MPNIPFMKQPTPVENIKQKLAAANIVAEQALVTHQAAAYESEINEGDKAAQKNKDAAAEAFRKALQRCDELAAALVAAETKEELEAQQDAKAELSRRWDDALKLIGAREEAAVDAEKSIAALKDAFDRLQTATGAFITACPNKIIDPDGTLVRNHDMESVLRLALVKAGFRWAATYPWESERIPALSKRIKDAAFMIKEEKKRRCK